MKNLKWHLLLRSATFSGLLLLFLHGEVKAMQPDLDLLPNGTYPHGFAPYVRTVKATDGLVIVGGEGGLTLMDRTATCPLGGLECGTVSAIAAQGSTAYVTKYSEGIELIDVSFPALPRSLGRCRTPGKANDCRVENDRLYVADGTNGLCIVDVSSASAPFVLCSVPGSGAAYSISVSRNFAFLSQGDAGLRIIDVTDAMHPLEAGQWTNETVWEVALNGSLAFAACGTGGVVALDLSAPASPQVVGTCRAAARASALAISGTHLFVAGGSDGLKVLDVADPQNPRLVTTLNPPGGAWGINAAGSRAFVPSGRQGFGLHVFDISSPNEPLLTLPAHWATGIHAAALRGGVAYLASTNWGLALVDVSNPGLPRYLGHCPTPGTPVGIALAGNLAYLATAETGLQVVDVSDVASPRLVGGCDTIGSARSVSINANFAYVADGSAGLQIVDVANPSAPRLLGSLDTAGFLYAVAVAGTHVYAADGTNGLLTIDVSDPAAPRLVDTHSEPGSYCGVLVSSGRAYAANTSYGIDIFDLASPARPELLGGHWDCGLIPSGGLALAGSHLFVNGGTGGVRAIDVSDSLAPHVAGSYNELGNSFVAVSVEGNMLAVAGPLGGLRLVELRPALPKLLATHYTTGHAWMTELSGNYAYVPEHSAGVVVYDITDTSNVRTATAYNTSGTAYSLALDGDRLYLADGQAGLRIFLLSTPDDLLHVAQYDTPGTAQCVKIADGRAYVADGTNGLEIIDVRDYTKPLLRLGGYNTPGDACALAVNGSRVVLVDKDSELHVLDVSNPADIRRLGGFKIGAKDVALRGDLAFVVSSSGVSVLDLTVPAQPVQIGSAKLSGISGRCALLGNYAYVTGLTAGLQVLDISNPAKPERIAGNVCVPSLEGVAVRGDLLIAAGGNDGLAFFRMLPAFASVTAKGNQLELSWHAFGPTRLQSAINSGMPRWHDIPGSESTNRLTLPPLADRELFRLIIP